MKNNLFQPRLLHNFIINNAERYPDKAALIFEEKRINYSTLDEKSNQLAKSLIELGIKRHDRVIIFLENSIECVISIWSVLKAGGIIIILNTSIKPNKLLYIINDSRAKVIISSTSKYDVVSYANNNNRRELKTIWVGAPIDKLNSFSFNELINTQSISLSGKLSQRQEEIIDYDLAALFYISGCTGEPKGVMSPQFNMISAARSIIEYIGNIPDDVILNVLPLSSDYGLYQMLTSIMMGSTLILESSFMFPFKILQTINRERVTGFPIVPTIIALLLKIKELEKYELRSLRYISNTGAAFPIPHIQKFRQIFPHIKIYSMYGITECKRISYLPPEEINKKPGSVGKAMPNCEVFIYDESGKEVQPGEVGELVVRGSNVMRGYWNSPELTDCMYRPGIFQGEKLLYTGDLFRKGEGGYLYFLGRKDDIIKSRGERISPTEIENILCAIPYVSEAAVVGVPDEILGQAIKAFIVLRDGIKSDVKSILQYCYKSMESFMVPKYVEFISELPKDPNGKIDKKVLRAESILVNPGFKSKLLRIRNFNF